MPELPEVQTVVDDLNAAGVPGHRIIGVTVRWAKSVLPLSPSEFESAVCGTGIRQISRRAKYIRMDLDDGHLLVHLRMSGRLELLPSSDEYDPHHHVGLLLADNREIRLHDTRKFGRVIFTETPQHILAALGPEPLDPSFTATCFHNRLGASKRQLKPLLLDQRFIAGLGNIYVDESLWLAKIHPLRRSHTLNAEEAETLLEAIRAALRKALQNRGTSLGNGEGNYASNRSWGRNKDTLNVFRLHGRPCPRCGTMLRRITVGRRSTHICPSCQTSP